MFFINNFIRRTAAVSALLLVTGSLAAQTDAEKDSTAAVVVVKAVEKKGVPVSGVVKDAATGKGLAGIRIEVEGFSAAITDDQGKFSIIAPSYGSTLSIAGEGYDSRRVPLKGRNSIEFSLLSDSHISFHEPVEMPFGPVTKGKVTAATGQYNINAAWSQPGEMADGILQGRIAGLQVIRRSGNPGAGANLFLRGYNSLYGTNKPLIIVDNMLYDGNEYGESIIANNVANPLALIDVKDIDNITVLKDASSIYGTKGANGAIIITTSRTKNQATRIDFAAYTGFNTAPKDLPVMNASDYRIYLSEMLQSKGMPDADIARLPYMNDDEKNADYARYHYKTDWQKQVLRNSANQNIFLKVTGGDNIATYGLSMGYAGNQGIVKQTDLTRYNTRFNAVFNFTRRFTGTANLSFTYNEQNLKDQGMADKTAPLFLSWTKAPFLPANEVNDKGVESPNLTDADLLGLSNPAVIIANMQAYNKYYRFFGSFGFKYDISKSLSASTLMGVVFDKVRENFFVPRKGVADDTLTNAIAESRMGTQVKRLFTIYNDTRLTYNRQFGRDHALTANLGLRYQHNKAEQDYAKTFNSATDDLVSVQNGVAALRLVGGGIGEWNWLNTYFGAQYGFRDKYFGTLNAALDGSSRFGTEASEGLSMAGRKFPLMYSVGGGWLISSEQFMANSFLDLLKLRATYSVSGNDDIGNYSGRMTYRSQNLLGAQGLLRGGIANPALQWEKKSMVNAGIDLSFWNERVGLSADVYHASIDRMLVYETLPTASGFTTILTNNGSMENTGIEANVNVRILNLKDLSWDAGFNIATNKNKIKAVPGNRFTTTFADATILTAVGQPASQFYGYTTQGVFASDAEAAAAGLSSKNANGSLTPFKGGDIHFTDLDNNKVIDDNDRQVIGEPHPVFFGGFNNRLIWKQFELGILFTFNYGNDVFNYVRYRLESLSSANNQLESARNRWRGDGHVTNMPKATWGDPVGNSRFSDRWIEDGSYIRLRSVAVQYNLPIRPGSFLKNASIYANGTNLFTLTKYKGYDPEFSATPSVFTQGIDTGLDPLFRTVTVGVRVGL
ncbi:SusC/RagA family TonB-linked outer membrane protein [Paraflavitalea sp. CAU 1676]|uniref:SusC/RagA family TonB-linked outer membrane protein n=1 Tax=Paraflavitalea sp. CAU 1676 TaxID=3032598 RepID=UPI0023DCA7BF|nr:SusC/RagA family TonB-linked outer membrane protein [Paraflavitalea sp. CAU 1676]MDF2192894.1 SusC/RagA family TonB-linked outer membrane protein [Paraflavitalea sp. CAU 1676]